ncbi:autophagy protein 13 [Arachnomyces sp. PD_36]|nr:autophagy protein 13 [Arachnomyces sp. PD_36]
MHQHPRSTPATASPAASPRTNPARTNNRRDRDPDTNTQNSEVGDNIIRGLGIEDGAEAFEQDQNTLTPAREALAKLNQIVQNYFTKAALIILHSRIDLPPSYQKGTTTKRVNKWFNVELDETDTIRDELLTWKNSDSTESRPPPMIIETFLDAEELTNNQSLVIIDDLGKRWDVLEALAAARDNPGNPRRVENRIILERWRIELGQASDPIPADLGPSLPTVYKKSIVLFRSLFTYSKFLPAWKFSKRQGKLHGNPALKVQYRILKSVPEKQRVDNLTIPLYENGGKPVESYTFGATESPAGSFSVHVEYRTNCEFRVDDSEALLSSRFMGADDEFFRPSLPSTDPPRGPELGSLPVQNRGVDPVDRGQAYGSLSTFHQVGPKEGSPISALRAARELGPTSPTSSPPQRQHTTARAGQQARAAMRSGDHGRRPSISFQPFKAPSLSASPAPPEPPAGVSPRTTIPIRPTSSNTTPQAPDTKNMPPPTTAASAARKPSSTQQDNANIPSTSASPKPNHVPRYSSSFSHRRGRPSSGGASKTDDDNNSSGKASATSSTAQPGSGVLAEGGVGSSDSMHTDDENISAFLKMLDGKKDLLTGDPSDPAAAKRKTSALLSRYQRMKESNAALSDSMSSSLHLQRSSVSSSRQLSSVPPMVAGTSLSPSSSPGKPISPHTPHTPAIPSRLSANSIVDYSPHADHNRSQPRERLTNIERESTLDETDSTATTMEPRASGVNAIDIPTSPRPLIPTYRRPSSAAQQDRAVEDEMGDFFPYGMRSASLGAGDRSALSLSELLQQPDTSDNATPSADARQEEQTQGRVDEESAAENSAYPEFSSNNGSARSPRTVEPLTTSTSNTQPPRLSHRRGRGSTSGPASQGSASSSLGRGAPINTGRDVTSAGVPASLDTRRGGHRQSFSRHTTTQDDDEPLLFTMSDFGASRRSIEEANRGSGDGSASGSRRGSGRRGGGGAFSGFHAWQ